MPIEYKNVKKQFEKSMELYDKNAIVQEITASKMVAELAKIQNCFDNILELGAGTGLTTKQIKKEIKFENYYANDLVEKSKYYIQKIIPNANFYCGNALKIKPNRKMDLIISNAMFQWFENLNSALETLKISLLPDGFLAFSTFLPSNFKELTNITGLSLSYKTKDEIINILQKHNFEILYCEEFCEKMTFNTPLELLAHLKNTGVNSLSEKVWTVKKVKDFCDKYSQKYKNTTLTYCPLIVIARIKL